MSRSRLTMGIAAGAVALLALVGCSNETTPGGSTDDGASTGSDYYPITVTDMTGNEVTIESADRVVVTDNRFFQIAADWDLPIVAAPRSLMSPNNPLADDDSILNTGNHREPDLEQIVAADPDLIINGYRYSGEVGEGVRSAAPDAAFIDMTNDDLTADEYIVESITLMGEIFNKTDEAAALIDEFHTALEGAREAYDPTKTVMGLITTGGEINYSNPLDGRGASIFFDLVDLTPALDTSGSTGHTGDNVSLEALAEADADYFLVLDRDAAVGTEGSDAAPALELIDSSAALSSVPAVVNQAIYVMPADYYLTEDVFAYIAVLDGLAELFRTH